MLSMLTMLIKTIAYQNHAMLVNAMQWDQLELFWTICLQDSTITDQTLLDVFNYVESKHLKGRFGPRVGDGNVFCTKGGQFGTCFGDVTFFAPKEVSWDPVLVT